MNHKNNAELEGIVQKVTSESFEGTPSVSVFLKSTQTSSYKGKENTTSFSIWLKFWGKLAKEAEALKKDDLIKVSGTFKTQAKDVEIKTGMIKIYTVQINVKTLEKLIVDEGLTEGLNDELPF